MSKDKDATTPVAGQATTTPPATAPATAPPAAEPPKPKVEPSQNGKPVKAIVPPEVKKPDTPATTTPPAVLTHEPSGEECSLPHRARGNDPGGPCQRCLHCKKKLRPQEMTKPCPARA